MRLDFLGATEEVTGSKFLLTSQKGTKILLDCGMYQGKGLETDSMNRNLGFNPKEVDFILLSHAHIDHSGLIPYIYKQGFRGKVFCTPATRDLCAIMLADSGRIQEADARQFNKKKERVDKEPIEPIYTEKDAAECMAQFISIPRNLTFNITPDISIQFIETGHMLGSGAIYITFKEGRKTRTLCYTGDVGRYNKRILPDPEPFPYADYIITESTYGDRLHSTLDDADKQLMLIVRSSVILKMDRLEPVSVVVIEPAARRLAHRLGRTLQREDAQRALPAHGLEAERVEGDVGRHGRALPRAVHHEPPLGHTRRRTPRDRPDAELRLGRMRLARRVHHGRRHLELERRFA